MLVYVSQPKPLNTHAHVINHDFALYITQLCTLEGMLLPKPLNTHTHVTNLILLFTSHSCVPFVSQPKSLHVI